jgi:hypothetical protein
MALDRQRLIKVFKEECENLDSSNSEINDYKKELFNAVCDIIYQESLHQERATRIQQKVQDTISRLSEMVTE